MQQRAVREGTKKRRLNPQLVPIAPSVSHEAVLLKENAELKKTIEKQKQDFQAELEKRNQQIAVWKRTSHSFSEEKKALQTKLDMIKMIAGQPGKAVADHTRVEAIKLVIVNADHPSVRPLFNKVPAYIPYKPDLSWASKQMLALNASQHQMLLAINRYIEKTNEELKKQCKTDAEYHLRKRHMLSLDGQCHGIVLYMLWLVAQHLEKQYAEQVWRMMSCPADKLSASKALFEPFIQNIQRGQEPEKYIDPKITQANVDKILGFESVCAPIEGLYDYKQIEQKLSEQLKENQLMSLTGTVINIRGEKKTHSIGLFCRESRYYLLDPNATQPILAEFEGISKLTDEIKLCFSKRINATLASNMLIRMNVVASPHAAKECKQEVTIPVVPSQIDTTLQQTWFNSMKNVKEWVKPWIDGTWLAPSTPTPTAAPDTQKFFSKKQTVPPAPGKNISGSVTLTSSRPL